MRRWSRSGGCTGRRWQAVAAFARANRFDRIVLDCQAGAARHHGRPARPISICARRWPISASPTPSAQALGLRIYKVALTWPLEESGARRFAEGLQDVLVVEEKRGFIEDQLLRILYNVDASKRPVGGRQARRDRRDAAAERGRTDADHGGGARSWRGCAGSAIAARRCEQRLARSKLFERAGGRRRRRQAAAHAVFLLGLPAQHLDQDPRGQPRHGRHRLPRHGAVGAEPPHADDLAYGRRRRHLDRAGAVHQRSRTSSRIWATAPTPIPACWRSARRRPPASTSPTRFSTTTRWR